MSDTQTNLADRRLPGSIESGWLISRMFFRVSLGRKRILWIASLLLVPIGTAIYFRATGQGGMANFDHLNYLMFLQFFALGLPLYLGVSAIRDEIDDRTLIYLLARPVRRSVIIGGKILSVVLVVWLALAIDMVLVYLISVSAEGVGGLAAGLFRLLAGLGVLGLATVAYTALFSMLGILLKRPLIVAIIIGAGWEIKFSNLPGAFPKLTLMYYLKSLLGVAPEFTGIVAAFIPPIQPAAYGDALAVIISATVVFFSVSLIVGSSKEL